MPDNVKIDLTKLKETIDNQKKEQHTKQVALGNVPEGAIVKTNKKAFLNELVTSMHHGIKTSASEAIKAVNDTVEYKKGVPQAVAKNTNNKSYAPPRRSYVNENTQVQQHKRSGASDWGMAPNGNINVNGNHHYGDGERDVQFEQDFNNANVAFDQKMMANNPVMVNHPSYRHMIQQNQPQQQYVVETPSNQLNEQVELVNERIEKNLEKLVESSFKSVLTNIYTKQKIQESLVEFLQTDDGLKVIGRAINEIAKRNKAKQGK